MKRYKQNEGVESVLCSVVDLHLPHPVLPCRQGHIYLLWMLLHCKTIKCRGLIQFLSKVYMAIFWIHRWVYVGNMLHFEIFAVLNSLFLFYMIFWNPFFYIFLPTVCPRSSDPFCKESYYIKSVTTSWTYSTYSALYQLLTVYDSACISEMRLKPSVHFKHR